MPSISSCPTCHRDLTVPDSETADEVLRCPLCGSEFPAERILADSVRFPPLAIVVKSANSLSGGSEAPPAAPAGVGPSHTEPAETFPLAAMQPESVHGDAVPRVVTNLPLMAERNHDMPTERPFSESPEQEHFDAVVEEPVPGDQSMGIDLSRLTLARSAGAMNAAASGGAASGGVDATDADGGKSGEAAAGFEAPAMRVSTQPRPRGGGLTALVAQFVGVVVGGAMGLAIGYYILLWFAGAQADVLDMRSKLPSWLLPPIREQCSGNSEPESAEQNLAAQPSTDTPDDELGSAQNHDLVAAERAAMADDDAPPAANPSSLHSEPTEGEDHSIVRASFNGPLDDPSDERGSAYLVAERPGEAPFAEQLLPVDDQAPIMLGPRDPTMHSFDDLQAALERATSALRCPHCAAERAAASAEDVGQDAADSFRGEAASAAARRLAHCAFCRGSGIGNLTTAVFEQLCQLAESVTYASIGGHEDEAESLREEVEELLRSIGRSRLKSDIVGRLAAGRLDDRRRASNGVLLAGTVSEVGWQGDLFAIRLVLAGVARPVMVLGRDAPQPALEPRDRVLICGSIVDSPCDTVAGYLGDLPQVVWGGLALKISTRE